MDARTLTFVLLFGLAACATAERTDPRTRDMDAAVSLAVAALEARTLPAGDMVAISARRQARGGMSAWIVTFKLAHLIPGDSSDGIEGLGGEAFVSVDLDTGRTEIRGGE